MKILSKIPFDSRPEFVALNPKANQAFVSENKGNTISLIDFDSKTKSKVIEIERPRDIIYEPISNRLFVIWGSMGILKIRTGKRFAIIDVKSKRLLKDIGNDEGFAGISRNPKTNKIFLTQPHKKLVWVIDEKSLEVEDKINVKGKYSQIIVNENTGDLILVGTFRFSKRKISSFNIKSNKIEKTFSKIQGGFGDHFRIKYYPKINKIFVYLATPTSETSDSIRLYVIDFDDPDSGHGLIPEDRIHPYFDLDASNDFIYYVQKTSTSWYRWSKDQVIKRNVITNKKEAFDLDLKFLLDDVYYDYNDNYLIHPQTENLLIYGNKGKRYYLFEISLS